MSFPKSALLSEFGWEPINEFLDRQRVNYFARFDELPAHGLCKIVFMELKNSECGMKVCKLYEKYFPINRIRTLLATMEILIRTFKKKIGKAVQDQELSRRLEMSSLSIYNTFNITRETSIFMQYK